jgi:hypothetical protein
LDFRVLQCEPHGRLVLTLDHRILTLPLIIAQGMAS